MPLNQAASDQSEVPQEAFTQPIPHGEAVDGTVNLAITGSVAQMLSFVEQLRQDGRFRLFRLGGNPSQGMDVQMGLREPLHLQDVLSEMNGVGQVSLLDSDKVRYSVGLE